MSLLPLPSPSFSEVAFIREKMDKMTPIWNGLIYRCRGASVNECTWDLKLSLTEESKTAKVWHLSQIEKSNLEQRTFEGDLFLSPTLPFSSHVSKQGNLSRDTYQIGRKTSERMRPSSPCRHLLLTLGPAPPAVALRDDFAHLSALYPRLVRGH